MQKLSKQQAATKQSTGNDLIVARHQLEDAVSLFNTRVGELWAELVEPKVEKYNAVIQDAANWRDELVGEMDSYIDERSDAWNSGDKGTAYNEWKDAWEGLGLEEFEIDKPSEVELDLPTSGEDLKELADAPE